MTTLDSTQATTQQLRQAAVSARPSGASVAETGNAAPRSSSNGNELPPARQVVVDAEQVQQRAESVASQLSEFAQSIKRGLSFTVDDITGQTVITVKDSLSDEVIRQIPSEEVLQLARKLQELEESSERLQESSGNLFNLRV